MNASSARDDAAVLRAVAHGDEQALKERFDRHAPWLQARLNRRCADPEVVADVLQDTFVAAWKGARAWRGDGDVAAWLWGIAARRLISRLRGRPGAVVVDAQSAALDSPLASVEEQVLLGFEHGDLGSALQRLSPELLAVVQATILDGLSTREAAQLLGLPQGTVKGRIRAAEPGRRFAAVVVPGAALLALARPLPNVLALFPVWPDERWGLSLWIWAVTGVICSAVILGCTWPRAYRMYSRTRVFAKYLYTTGR